MDVLGSDFAKPETGCEHRRTDQGKQPSAEPGERQLSRSAARRSDAARPDGALHGVSRLGLNRRSADRGLGCR